MDTKGWMGFLMMLIAVVVGVMLANWISTATKEKKT